MNILYEDAFIVVLDKPAGLSSEEGVPAALRQRWNAPDAFVGVVHRLDTGVSGLAASRIGRKLHQSSKGRQVLCITHTPQIAAFADNQLLIEKKVRNDRTFTEIHPLDEEGRVEALARLISGDHVTELSRANAREMLGLGAK